MMIITLKKTGWRSLLPVLLMGFALCVPSRVFAADTFSEPFAGMTVRLASLDWPPYTGENLPGEGTSAIISRHAFAVSNIDMTTVFYPWRRVLDSLQSDTTVVGYYPEYKTARLEQKFYFSDSIGTSPLGFVYLAETAFNWSVPDDLKNWRVGVVAGYVNQPVFDQMVKNGELHTLAANDDLTLLRLLNAGRIDVAVMDEQVLHYLTRTTPELSPAARKFVFHPRKLDTKTLHVAFRRTDLGQKLRDLFNYGLHHPDKSLISSDSAKLLSQ
jgi:polar amino acid transport system substrate-binding protein